MNSPCSVSDGIAGLTVANGSRLIPRDMPLRWMLAVSAEHPVP
jgi:hypothetical protein